jgi:hypothetical protein
LPDRVGTLLLRALGFLIPALALWYLAGPWVVWLPGQLAGRLLHGLFPSWIQGFELRGTTLVLSSSLPPGGALGADLRVYSIGLPMVTALLLASRARKLWWKWPAAAALLVPLQVWGACCQLLLLACEGGPAALARTGFSSAHRDAIAMGFQLGVLLFPCLGPVLVWLALERENLAGLVHPATASGSAR